MKLKINYRKIGWISLCIVIFAILNGYFMFPKILEFMLTRVSFHEGSTSGWKLNLALLSKESSSIFRFFRSIFHKNLQLRPGSQMRPLFERIPFPLTFKAYIFNITNSKDVISGSKPILKEIGPYVFEWVSKWAVIYDARMNFPSY